ncbi:CDP-alcohol phosphatidyltransferase family protein [Candidatus Kaiserbacteria bacterium]|nr:CDP-alcohol phosphatidyltransferase family protein [Candidatus Kaiserbacteria bacterium]MCB9812539.1 CDP-alcohol phosphatidyltransferase family protein [Candidatus Nomurabacteria bacterium]
MTVELYWQETKRQWNVPNVLTMSRAVTGIALPLFWYGGPWWLVGAIVFAGVSDGLDGYLARKLKTETPIGGVLDPLADKVFTDFFLLGLAFTEISIWFSVLAVVTILYDIDNTYQRRGDIVTAFRGTSVPPTKPVTKLSKVKTALLFFVMAVVVLYPGYLAAYVPYVALELLALLALSLVVASWALNRQQLFRAT